MRFLPYRSNHVLPALATRAGGILLRAGARRESDYHAGPECRCYLSVHRFFMIFWAQDSFFYGAKTERLTLSWSIPSDFIVTAIGAPRLTGVTRTS